jgi:hypothetical protein
MVQRVWLRCSPVGKLMFSISVPYSRVHTLNQQFDVVS